MSKYIVIVVLTALFIAVGVSSAIDLGDILKRADEITDFVDKDESIKFSPPMGAFPDVWELEEMRCVENCPEPGGTDLVHYESVYERRIIKIPALIGRWKKDE